MKKTFRFTLVELMVCLVVLGLVATAIGWQTARLIAHHRFQSDGTHLYTALQEGQLLAMMYQTDATLTLYPQNGELFYQFASHEPAAAFHPRPQQLPGTSLILWNPSQGKKQKLTLTSKSQPIQLKIFASGRIDPMGKLQLYPKNQSKAGVELDLSVPLKVRWNGQVNLTTHLIDELHPESEPAEE